MGPIIIKRIYEEVSENDGYRILVDRLWPRGVSKERANIDEWNKMVTPSVELRKWFDHKADRFQEFEIKYKAELLLQIDELNRIRKMAMSQQVTLLYAAKDVQINHAVILRNVLLRS